MFKGRHFDRSVIMLCVRWYLAYGLSLRNLEEMMAERGVTVDHATIHRWTVHYAPLLLEQFNRRKRAVSRRWHVDETGTVICGRSPLARDLLTCVQGGRVQSYVRPVGAAHLTAGPDEIRRSGP